MSVRPHRLVTFHGWLTFCYFCRRVRHRNPASQRYFARPCRSWEP